MNHADVKPDDELLLVISSGYGREKSYYKAVVTKTSKTRFTVKFGDYEKVFDKESGREYPRSSGFHSSRYELRPMDEDAKRLIVKQRLSSKARSLANKLTEIFNNANYREKIINMEIDDKELEKNIAILEKAYDVLKKYGPQD